MIQTYYGNGKGKTTAALGSALRASGDGKKCAVISFLKDNSSHERFARSNIYFYSNPDKLPFLFQMSEDQKREYSVWCKKAISEVFSGDFDFIVLDEFLDIIELVGEDFIKTLNFEKQKEYIITGHKKNDYVFEISDYITEMKKIRHPYDKGVFAREGIEY